MCKLNAGSAHRAIRRRIRPFQCATRGCVGERRPLHFQLRYEQVRKIFGRFASKSACGATADKLLSSSEAAMRQTSSACQPRSCVRSGASFDRAAVHTTGAEQPDQRGFAKEKCTQEHRVGITLSIHANV